MAEIERETLFVRNFGPLREVELDLSDVTLLIGPQASGKSTLAKLIHFCRYRTSLTPEGIRNLLYKYFPETHLGQSPDAYFRYERHDPGQPQKITLLNYEHKKVGYSPFHRESKNALLIPAGRTIYSLVSHALFGLMEESINIDPLILQFGRRIENIKGRELFQQQTPEVKKLAQAILKADLRVEDGEERIYFSPSENQYVTLVQASSGQQAAVPVLLALLDALYGTPSSCITVEEPEAHLFPYAQYKLVELMCQVYNKPDAANALVIATHSPYILSSFNNLLYAHQVAQHNEAAKAEVNAVVPPESQLDPRRFSAYYLEDGTLRSIMDDGLISENEIDNTSENIAEVFDTLLDIYRSHHF